MTGTSTPDLSRLAIKIFLDGADLAAIKNAMANMPLVKGFTTNPSLMRKAGVTDYAAYAKEALGIINGRPISFEVFSDEFDDMERQARIIASWGPSAYVKIPVSNTKGEPSFPLIKRLADAGVPLNVTVLMTAEQVARTAEVLNPDVPAVVSVFAGRVADTGRDPLPLMRESARLLQHLPKAELLWASPREILNIFQAEETGCRIITVAPEILARVSGVGRDLDDLSLEGVRIFYKDACAAGFTL